MRTKMYGENGQVIGNHDNRLGMGDYAVSPNLAAGHKVGDTFSFVDSKGVLHRGRYEDTSMRAPGVPNKDVIEAWSQKDVGRIEKLNWDKPPVTVNYTIHSLVDSSHFEKLLREHAEQIAHHVRGIFSDDDARSAVV